MHANLNETEQSKYETDSKSGSVQTYQLIRFVIVRTSYILVYKKNMLGEEHIRIILLALARALRDILLKLLSRNQHHGSCEDECTAGSPGSNSTTSESAEESKKTSEGSNHEKKA